MTGSIAHALVAELAALPDDQLAPLADRLASLLGDRIQTTHRLASPFLTAAEAAELLRCRRRRIYELVNDGRLTRCGDGRRLLVRRQEVEHLAEGHGAPNRALRR